MCYRPKSASGWKSVFTKFYRFPASPCSRKCPSHVDRVTTAPTTYSFCERPTSCASTTARHSRPGVLAFSHQCVVQQHIFASLRSLYSAVPSRIVPAPVGYRYVNLVTCSGSCFQAARRILEQLGVELHPQKTRMVQVRCGFEFLGYKIKLGYRKRHLPESKIRSQANRSRSMRIPRQSRAVVSWTS
jgi:hypothetical protein